MFGLDGILGDWLDRLQDDRGGLLINLDHLELPWGGAHLRTSGKIRVSTSASPAPAKARKGTKSPRRR